MLKKQSKKQKNKQSNKKTVKQKKAKKGDWVRIHSILMEAGSRAPGVPDDTAKVPYELWDKGFLLYKEAKVGHPVKIETITGREIAGTLIEVDPSYNHSFGSFIPEILQIDRQLRKIMGEITQ